MPFDLIQARVAREAKACWKGKGHSVSGIPRTVECCVSPRLASGGELSVDVYRHLTGRPRRSPQANDGLAWRCELEAKFHLGIVWESCLHCELKSLVRAVV